MTALEIMLFSFPVWPQAPHPLRRQKRQRRQQRLQKLQLQKLQLRRLINVARAVLIVVFTLRVVGISQGLTIGTRGLRGSEYSGVTMV